MPLFQENKPLSEISTFGIGGPAKYFIEADSIEKIQQAVLESQIKKIPYLVIGKGSNTLFSSQGFHGLVILNKITFIKEVAPHTFHVGAGYSFSHLGTKTARENLTGLEFASGIPGSVGGAVFMNAGANGQETKDTLISVDFLEESGEIKTYLKENLKFSYRTSPFQEKKGVILAATFKLEPLESARKRQIEIISYRKKTQPYSEMSVGCIFRNPENQTAGKLIEESGLKGLKIGDAEVSDIHANFIINKNQATSEDVLSLIRLVQEKVKEKTGLHLESEVRFIPYHGN